MAALLGSTFLATPVRADPVSAFIGGFLNSFGAGTFLTSASVGAWSAGFSAGAWLTGGGFIANTVLSVGLSALSQSLIPTPQVPSPSDRMVNWAQPVAQMERCYGRVRKGGPYALSAFSKAVVTNPDGDDKRGKRHYGIIIASHRTRGPVQHWLDKWPVEVDDDGFVTTSPIKWEGSAYHHWHGSIRAHTGGAGQVVDPIWDSVFPEITSADDFAGLSYAALYACRPSTGKFNKVYPSGREWTYAPVWDGHDRIYDPRTDTYDWTDNAALIIAHEALYHGKAVDWDQVAAEADISDEIVTNAAGATQKRWTINGTFDDSMTWETVRAQLQVACDAFFYERTDGKLGFKVGGYSAPTITLTDADFLSFSVKEGAWGPDVIGQVSIRYVEPERDYVEEGSGAYLIDPDGARHEEPCGLINNHNQAARVAKRWAKTARPQYSVRGVIKPIGYELIEERFARIQHAELDFDQVVEIGRYSRNGGSHTFTLEGVSVTGADFAFNALIEEPDRPLRAVIVEDDAVAIPASLSGEVIEGTGGVALIEWSWPEQPDDLRQQLRVRSIEAGVVDWQILDVPAEQLTLVSSGLVDGATYEAQVRNRTLGGVVGDWGPAVPLAVVAVANTDAPAAMSAFAGAPSGSDVVLTFTAPNDALYAAARIWRATSSTDFADAVLIRTEFGAANAGDTYTDVAPGVATHSYWIEPINGSGIAGPRTGPENITII